MPTLRIKNLTRRRLVFDRVVGAVAPEETKDVDIAVAEVEFLRPSLTRMRDLGLIEFNHFNVEDDGDDDTEFVTLADIKLLLGELALGPSTAGSIPLAGSIDGANTVFTSPTPWTRDDTAESVYYNGVRLTEGIGNDYVATESVPAAGYDTLTFTFSPQPGDILTIDFYSQ
jgi:hypothetical protein